MTQRAQVTERSGARAGWLWRTENLLAPLALALLVAVPLGEALLRKGFHAGIPGSAAISQHLVLWVCMLGAMLAAREGKLLTLFEFASFGSPAMQRVCRSAGHFGAAVISGVLAVASALFVNSERGAGGTLAFGIPLWMAQSIMPLGFAAIALRLLWRAPRRVVMLAAAAKLLGMAVVLTLLADHGDLLFWLAAAALAAVAACGAPIFAVLGGAGLLLFWHADIPIAAVALDHYRMVVNPSLPAIPLFTLAGFALASGNAPARLTQLFQALFGHFRGGVAIASVVVGAFFTALTGGSGVTILALGGVLLPLLVKARYAESDAVGLVTVSGSLGTLLAPCLPLILYAIVAQVPIGRMFAGAALPAVLMIALVAIWGARRDPRQTSVLQPFRWPRAWQAIRAAKWELGLPVVVFAALFGGFATPVEAAALTALYALFVECCIHRGIRNPARLLAVMGECGALVGGVLLILGVALGITNYCVDGQWPDRIADWAVNAIHAKWLFLLLLNLLLLLAGCVMEIWAAIVVLPPLLLPIGTAFGIDPLHLGVIFLANLELGYLTPLVGINLFYASARFDKPVMQVCRDVLPIWPVLVAGVLIVTYVPWLTTALPGWLG
jgi:C4-dicarboxylate transporter DctM subunit